jgi:hypothetical protein
MENYQVATQQLGTQATADRRLEKRMPVELTIEVSGFDCSSRYFSERTETRDVSESGCKFRLHTVLAPETVVAVRALCQCETEVSPKAVLFRIVRICHEPHAVSMGAQALQPFQPHGLQWGTLYRSLLFALLFSAIRRTPV